MSGFTLQSFLSLLATWFIQLGQWTVANWQVALAGACVIVFFIALLRSLMKVAVSALTFAILLIVINYMLHGDASFVSNFISGFTGIF